MSDYLKSYTVLTMQLNELIQDIEALVRIILRNLLDRAQAVLMHAFDLSSNPGRNSMSSDWSKYVTDIDESTRLEKIKALLNASTIPVVHQLAAHTMKEFYLAQQGHPAR